MILCGDNYRYLRGCTPCLSDGGSLGMAGAGKFSIIQLEEKEQCGQIDRERERNRGYGKEGEREEEGAKYRGAVIGRTLSPCASGTMNRSGVSHLPHGVC